MFRIRRICKPNSRPDTWKVAGLLKRICAAYEEKGRSPATIYVSGFGTPGAELTVCAEWDQPSIEANLKSNVPDIITSKYSAELGSLVASNNIEFYEIATTEKLKLWGEA
jgi:hypothetical protein